MAIVLTTMTSGVGDVKLSQDRESRHDKLANNSAQECSYIASGSWRCRAGALSSVNRMAAPPRRVDDATLFALIPFKHVESCAAEAPLCCLALTKVIV